MGVNKKFANLAYDILNRDGIKTERIGNRLNIKTNKSSLMYNVDTGRVFLGSDMITKLNNKFEDNEKSELKFRTENIKNVIAMADLLYRLDGYNPNNKSYLSKIEFDDFVDALNKREAKDLRKNNVMDLRSNNTKNIRKVANAKDLRSNNAKDLRKNNVMDLRSNNIKDMRKVANAKDLRKNNVMDLRSNNTKNIRKVANVKDLRKNEKTLVFINDKFYVGNNLEDAMFNYYDSFNKNANLANKNIKRIFVATLNGNTGKISINKCDNITRNAIAKELSDFLKNKLKIIGRI